MELNGNDEFEIKAEAFRRMTGFMAPGKSVAPAAYAGEEYDEQRRQAWDKWTKEHGKTLNAVIAAIEHVLP